MPIYGKSKLGRHIKKSLSKNLSTLAPWATVDNYSVNYFVIHPFFRDLYLVYSNMGTVFAIDTNRFTIFNEDKEYLWMIIFHQGLKM